VIEIAAELAAVPRRTKDLLQRTLQDHQFALEPRAVGWVESMGPGVVWVGGLRGTGSEELLHLRGGGVAMALELARGRTGAALLDRGQGLGSGGEVKRTGRVAEVPVGEELLGRVMDPLGRPLDGKRPVAAKRMLPVERPAPAIMDRAPVTVPLQTGIKVVDAMIPVGRGQRELILGDRQTGKTALALDAMLNQADADVACVYCGVGKRASALARVTAALRERGAMSYSLVVATTEEDPPGLVYLAPYAATSMAEHFMAQGRDVLIVYDDLTRHARAYRELSLLLRRPPGREAFPGDIFYVHSRLLERSTHMNDELGGGSLTALPIAETEAENISAYIPTNLVSITDGQIYLSPRLFHKGNLPAVDAGRSVSRVGGKTQLAAYRAVAGQLRLTYSQFEELEGFARFGTRLDQDTKEKLTRGRRVREVLKQPQYATLPVCQQIAALVAVNDGLFDEVPLEQVGEAEEKVRQAVA